MEKEVRKEDILDFFYQTYPPFLAVRNIRRMCGNDEVGKKNK